MSSDIKLEIIIGLYLIIENFKCRMMLFVRVKNFFSKLKKVFVFKSRKRCNSN